MSEAYGSREIRLVLYQLKKRWSCPITWRVFINKSQNYRTGDQSVNYDDHEIKKAILLPSDISRTNLLPVITGMFKQGSFFDLDARYVIIENRDMPSGYDLTNPVLNDIIIAEDISYELKQIQTQYAIWLKMKRVEHKEESE